MKHAAVVIGVNETGGLPPLSGAVPGAKEFAAWAKGQGMLVKLITDENDHAVTLSEIQDAIDVILKPRNCKKLIVFFAGHGFLLSPQVELWLLSKAPGRGQEAVNVQLSRDHARFSGIGHVIFVSDACRSGGPTHQHRSVVGASIFPPPTTYSYDGKLDTFYATRPGDTALEYRDEQEAVNSYRGLFTEALLEALRGDEPNVVRMYEEQGTRRWLILSELLEDYLETVVPLKAENISIKLSQTPIVIPESRFPQYFGEVAAGAATRVSNQPPTQPPTQPEPSVPSLVANIQKDVMSFNITSDAIARAAQTEAQRQFADQVDQITNVRGRDHFETETGFSVFGQVQSVQAGGNWDAELIDAGDVSHIRVIQQGKSAGGSLLMEFESGIGTVVAIKPGYIGTVLIDKAQVVNVNYTPSSNTFAFEEEYIHDIDRIERRRAFAATATRHGVFQLQSAEAQDAGDYLRMMKRMDPTLGIYAAYAYHQAGRQEQIRSIVDYMAQDGLVPFDVLLLARQAEPWPPYAPFCPMLRQGWALLPLHPASAQRLSVLQSMLLPSLWATYTREGVAHIRAGLDQGEFT